MKFIIFANGDIYDYEKIKNYISKESTIICCDGGYRHAEIMGIKPDYVLGDFDSISIEKVKLVLSDNKIISYPTKKDYTDLEIGINFAINNKATEIVVLGGIGDRFDHTLMNAQLLIKAVENNVKAQIVNEKNIITIIKDEIILYGKINTTISLIPLTTCVKGISTEGLHYKLMNENLELGSSRGISNFFDKEKVKISVKEGLLFIILINEI